MKKEICPCGGEMVKKKIDFSMYGKSLGKFPALVCTKCGDEYFEQDISDKINKIAKQKGLWGLESKTKLTEVGNSYAVRITKKLFKFLKLHKGEEVTLYPENQHKLIIEIPK